MGLGPDPTSHIMGSDPRVRQSPIQLYISSFIFDYHYRDLVLNPYIQKDI